MKKIVLIIVMAVLQTVMAWGQTSSMDTLPCGVRQRNYYYSSWFDTTAFYLRPDGFTYSSPNFHSDFANIVSLESTTTEWSQQFATRRIRIKGLWVMVKHDGLPYYTTTDTTKLPEYLYLCRRVNDWPSSHNYTYDFLMCVDSVRWDTAQPKMMCLKQTADGRKPNKYCQVYEALFDTVYTMSGEFWLGGSVYNNQNYDWVWMSYEHLPTFYARYSSPLNQVLEPYRHVCSSHGLNGMYSSYIISFYYGPFGVILDEQQYHVELPSADTARGIAKPTAYYPAGSHQTIVALSNSCYKFSHWSDGDTSNPRTILVTQDTSFTAYFDTVSNIYDAAVLSNDTSLGDATLLRRQVYPEGHPEGSWPFYKTVGTDSSYCEGDSAIFKAVARSDAYFWYWNDSVRVNPRIVPLTQDTVLTAIFKKEVPPEYLPPCPRMDKPVVVVEDTGRVLLTWGGSVYNWSWRNYYTLGICSQQESWEVAWGLFGMPPDSCEIISCDNFERVFDSLEAGVRYVAYVRALCKHNDTEFYGDWSDSVEIYFPYFPHRYTVRVATDYAERGRVYGGGEYDEGDVAMLTANAWHPYRFMQWNDGDSANPRYVVVTQDTSFSALFSEMEDITTTDNVERMTLLLPNPAKENVKVLTSIRLKGVEVFDAQGRQVLSLSAEDYEIVLDISQWAAGSYVVLVHTERGTASKRLLVGD